MDQEANKVDIIEVVQAGDEFLVRMRCPSCRYLGMYGFPLSFCSDCKKDFSAFWFDEPKMSNVRLLVGTFRRFGFRPTKKLIYRMKQEQGNACAYCFHELVDYHIEHIRPLAVGGSNHRDNLCLSCPTCNLLAGAKVFTNFRAKQEYILAVRARRKIWNEL